MKFGMFEGGVVGSSWGSEKGNVLGECEHGGVDSLVWRGCSTLFGGGSVRNERPKASFLGCITFHLWSLTGVLYQSLGFLLSLRTYLKYHIWRQTRALSACGAR